MESVNSYTTIGAVTDHIVEIHQKTGWEPSFPTALDSMRRNGMLLSAPPAAPPFDSAMDRAAFRAFIRATPVAVHTILAQPDPFLGDSTVYEPNLFPPGKDVFCFQHMPYMDRTLHFHDFFEITYVVEGTCTFLFEGETASLNEGDICITSPLSGHSLPLTPQCTALSVVVRQSTFNAIFGNLLTKQDLVSSFFRNCLYQPRRANYILLRTGNDQALFQTAQKLFSECYVTDDFANACSVGLLNLFLAQAMRAAAAITLHRYEKHTGRDVDFALILQHIQQNHQTVTLSSLASTFHFSQAYLSKLIHKNMGSSFTEIVRSVKMDHAMELLLNTPMKIHQIADAVGYDSADHFTRTFRRLYGMSPQQYRRRRSAAD